MCGNGKQRGVTITGESAVCVWNKREVTATCKRVKCGVITVASTTNNNGSVVTTAGNPIVGKRKAGGKYNQTRQVGKFVMLC